MSPSPDLSVQQAFSGDATGASAKANAISLSIPSVGTACTYSRQLPYFFQASMRLTATALGVSRPSANVSQALISVGACVFFTPTSANCPTLPVASLS